ncbi:MAG: cation diffusion facilitator family transporter [Planctomycetota bacterium]
MTEEQNGDRAQANREKRRVALSSVLAAVLLTATKLAMGLLTGSLGILSEAAHSGLDLVAAVVTLFAVRASSQPPDKEHTYGHGKVENLSALFETFLLLLTCVWIIWEAITRLYHGMHKIESSVWGFVVIVLSILVDVSRSRALMRAAKKHQSQALEADALHFSTDVWSSAVVLAGLACVWLSDRLGAPWLYAADALAALGVAGIVVWISVRLGRRTVDDLMDAVPPGLREDVARAAQVPGVLGVLDARVRRSGPDAFVDITLSVDRGMPFETAHGITVQAEEAVRKLLAGAHVVVHAEPAQPQDEGLEAQVRLISHRHGLEVHNLRITEWHDKPRLDLHVEVDRGLTVGEAHAKTEAFENDLRRAHPGLGRITTHQEPAHDTQIKVSGAALGKEQIRAALLAASRECNMRCQPHDIQVADLNGELEVTCHCLIDPGVLITAAHDLTQKLEQGLRTKFPQVARVVIHIEPDRKR